MNYLKENPKSHNHIYITFQMRHNFVQYQDRSKTKNVRHRGDLELAKAQVTQIVFIFLESKISFALKQIQRLHKKLFCVQTTFTRPKKSSIWSYKQTYSSVEEGNCREPSISKYKTQQQVCQKSNLASMKYFKQNSSENFIAVYSKLVF